MKNIWILSLFFVLLTSCIHTEPPQPQPRLSLHHLQSVAKIGISAAGQEFSAGGLSNLHFEREENGILYFDATTDRGPNSLDGVILPDGRQQRPFLVPAFQPRMMRIQLNPQDTFFTVSDFRRFSDSRGRKLNGLPPATEPPAVYEEAVDLYGKKLKPSANGMDAEGLCRSGDGWLVADEYGPWLLKFDARLRQQKKWKPGTGLSPDLAKRALNRGFEGLSCHGGYAYALLQSPLAGASERDKGHIRLVKFNVPQGRTEREYFYPVTEADKLGDLDRLYDDVFLIVEQTGLPGKTSVRKIYRVELAGAGDDGLLKKELVLDLNSIGFDFAEKIEGLAVIDRRRIALVTDNDFGVGGTVDFKSGLVKFKDDRATYLALITFADGL